MSKEQPTEKTTTARRDQIRVRVDRLRQSRQRSVIGVAELIALAGSAVMLLAVLFVYLSFYSPAQSRLATAQFERDRMQKRFADLNKAVEVKGTTQDSIREISASLERFEDDRLVGRDEGRVTLYNVLIQLIRANKLSNTSGPAYTYLEPKAPGARQSGNTMNSKWQSLYPGIGVTVTVEGQYANLRRFVRDIESSNQFIIINAVELEKTTDTEGATTTSGPPQRSTIVSLRLDISAYFRRAGSAVTEQAVSESR
ncbi:MAG: type pilus assembly protein PilO [Acidobacteriota bacterium]|jgi:hypothetical protein|nr:type pilus assembly protein PilO [Acidobacteriota bacterium]